MKIEHNIIKLHILKGMMWFMLAMPIIVVFFEDHGLSLMQIMQLQAAYSLSVALFEIPSGYIADLFGRKKTIVLSTIFSFIGYLIFSFYSGFHEFLLAEILVGIGGSLMSGSDTAILYDTLSQIKRKQEYVKIEGKNYAISNFSESIAGILGGLLAVNSVYLPIYIGGFLTINSLYMPIYIQTCILFFSIPIAITLIEPKLNNKALSVSYTTVIDIFRYSLIENTKLRWLIIYSGFMGVATLSIAWFAQPFFQHLNISILYFGILWASLNSTAGFSSYNAHKFKHKYILFYLALAMILSFTLLSFNQTMIGLIFIFIIYLLRGLVTPILKNMINININSDKRATVLSIRSFIIRISFAIIAPILGYISDHYTLGDSFLLLSFILSFFLLLSCYNIYKLDKNI